MGHNILPGMVMSSFIDRVPRKALELSRLVDQLVSAERALSYGIVSDVFRRPSSMARSTRSLLPC